MTILARGLTLLGLLCYPPSDGRRRIGCWKCARRPWFVPVSSAMDGLASALRRMLRGGQRRVLCRTAQPGATIPDIQRNQRQGKGWAHHCRAVQWRLMPTGNQNTASYVDRQLLFGGIDMDFTEAETESVIELRWEGPFSWPGFLCGADTRRFDCAAVASSSGIYLWTVNYSNGFLIYVAGITRRPFSRRFREHTRYYRTGVYTVFDVASLKQGVREKVWPGFWFRRRSPEKQSAYDRCSEQIGAAAEELLANYRIFLAPVAPIRRILERVEAAIMNNLYVAPGAASIIPDRGMALSARWENEKPLLVRSITPVLLHGLPGEFEA